MGRATTVRPDWVCEIVSPSSWAHDTVTKFQALQAHGVPHYWIVDLDRPLLTVYRHAGQGYLVAGLAQPGERARSSRLRPVGLRARLEPFEALLLDVSALFGIESPDGE